MSHKTKEELKLHQIYIEMSHLLAEANGDTNQSTSLERRKEIAATLRTLANNAGWLGPAGIKVALTPPQEGFRHEIHPHLLNHLSPDSFKAIYPNGWKA